MPMKNPLTLAGIEPATFRFVAQHLNHCATTVPTNTAVPTLKRSHIKRSPMLFFLLPNIFSNFSGLPPGVSYAIYAE